MRVGRLTACERSPRAATARCRRPRPRLPSHLLRPGDEVTALLFAQGGFLYSGHISGMVRRWELPLGGSSSSEEEDDEAPAAVALAQSAAAAEPGQQQQQAAQRQQGRGE